MFANQDICWFAYDRIRDSIGMRSTFLIMGAPETVHMLYRVFMPGIAENSGFVAIFDV